MSDDLSPWSARFDKANSDRVILPNEMTLSIKEDEPEIDHYKDWLEAIPEARLSSQAKRLYLHLIRWAQKDGVAYEHQVTMASKLGLTVNAIDWHIRALKDFGLIESARRTRSTSVMYRLLWVEQMPYPLPTREEGLTKQVHPAEL